MSKKRPNTITVLRSQLSKARANLLRAYCDMDNKDVRAVCRKMGLATKDNDPSISPSSVGTTITFSAFFTGLDGFKDPRLRELLEAIDSVGDVVWSSDDYASYMNRDYRAKIKVGDCRIIAIVSAYVKDDNPTCKRVVVSSSMKEVKEYKLVCE